MMGGAGQLRRVRGGVGGNGRRWGRRSAPGLVEAGRREEGIERPPMTALEGDEREMGIGIERDAAARGKERELVEGIGGRSLCAARVSCIGGGDGRWAKVVRERAGWAKTRPRLGAQMAPVRLALPFFFL